MSDRIKGFVVTMKMDVNEQHAEKLRSAMLMLDGVSSVEKSVSDYNDIMNRDQVRRELGEQIWGILYPSKK